MFTQDIRRGMKIKSLQDEGGSALKCVVEKQSQRRNLILWKPVTLIPLCQTPSTSIEERERERERRI